MVTLLRRQMEIRKGKEKEKKAPAPCIIRKPDSLRPLSCSWGFTSSHWPTKSVPLMGKEEWRSWAFHLFYWEEVVLQGINQQLFWMPGMWLVPCETLERRGRKTMALPEPPTTWHSPWHPESCSSFPSLEPPAQTPEDRKGVRSLIVGRANNRNSLEINVKVHWLQVLQEFRDKGEHNSWSNRESPVAVHCVGQYTVQGTSYNKHHSDPTSPHCAFSKSQGLMNW